MALKSNLSLGFSSLMLVYDCAARTVKVSSDMLSLRVVMVSSLQKATESRRALSPMRSHVMPICRDCNFTGSAVSAGTLRTMLYEGLEQDFPNIVCPASSSHG